MALSDRLARQIADVNAQIDALDAKFTAEKAALVAKRQALKNLKQSWTVQLDALLDAVGEFQDAR